MAPSHQTLHRPCDYGRPPISLRDALLAFGSRIDVPAVPHRELSVDRSGDPSDLIRARVARARERQLERFDGRLGLFADALLKTAIARLNLSARAYHRVLKIARTIADLASSARIEAAHVSEAVQYRALDRAVG